MDRLALKRHHQRQRKKRVRKKIIGSSTVPRISVYKSNCHLYIQAIDDQRCITIASAGTYGLQATAAQSPVERARHIGSQFAKDLLQKKVTRVVYDCNGNKYHGIVKEIADSMRSVGVRI